MILHSKVANFLISGFLMLCLALGSLMAQTSSTQKEAAPRVFDNFFESPCYTDEGWEIHSISVKKKVSNHYVNDEEWKNFNDTTYFQAGSSYSRFRIIYNLPKEKEISIFADSSYRYMFPKETNKVLVYTSEENFTHHGNTSYFTLFSKIHLARILNHIKETIDAIDSLDSVLNFWPPTYQVCVYDTQNYGKDLDPKHECKTITKGSYDRIGILNNMRCVERKFKALETMFN